MPTEKRDGPKPKPAVKRHENARKARSVVIDSEDKPDRWDQVVAAAEELNQPAAEWIRDAIDARLEGLPVVEAVADFEIERPEEPSRVFAWARTALVGRTVTGLSVTEQTDEGPGFVHVGDPVTGEVTDVLAHWPNQDRLLVTLYPHGRAVVGVDAVYAEPVDEPGPGTWVPPDVEHARDLLVGRKVTDVPRAPVRWPGDTATGHVAEVLGYHLERDAYLCTLRESGIVVDVPAELIEDLRA
jgi:hypothetical protein